MGHLYRFVEPVVLLLLLKKGRSYGYDLSGELHNFALTDAAISGPPSIARCANWSATAT